MTGYTREELLQMSFAQITPLEHQWMDAKVVQEVRATGRPQSYEKEYRRKDGRRVPVALTVFALRDAAGQVRGTGAVIRDITVARQLQRQLAEVTDREQRRIGSDIHDGMCQLLTATALAAKAVEHRLTQAGVKEARSLAEVVGMVEEANRRSRTIALVLHPVELERSGLMPALNELARQTQEQLGVVCSLQCTAEFGTPTGAKTVHVFRVVQEAISNAVRHGKAKHVAILAGVSGELAEVSVNDDGVGIPVEWPAERTGMGIHLMTYRAQMLGGTLEVVRRPAGGTSVRLMFPLVNLKEQAQ
jgi:PAS domain S-box-containing protein